MSQVIFLLGAGASMEAGMPSVVALTKELRRRLPHVRDVNGKTRREFPGLFDAIAKCDPEAGKNYERFFEWLSLLMRAQMEPFRRAIAVSIKAELAAAAVPLAFVVKQPIWKILSERHQSTTYRPDHLAKLGNFLPERGRLKVFTLNYDLCVEDACRAHGTNVITGFQPGNGGWSPLQFRTGNRGINLYKLHGSLNWGLDDKLIKRRLVERYPPKWDKEPELLLGPGSKLQHDDPFVTLYSEFHKAVRRAGVCVVIGYSLRDDHIKEPLLEAGRRGMTVIDVNPSATDRSLERYKKVSMGAKEAFESGVLYDAVRGVSR